MICIDFQGGSHGNYLEFVCNKFLAQVRTQGSPFNHYGASHNKVYLDKRQFKAWHYFDYRGIRTVPSTGKIVSIRVTEDDLLPLQAVSLLRAGDHNITQLEVNTYHKLNNLDYTDTLEELIRSFFTNQIRDSYNAVKDSSWPDVATIADFNNLPDHIKQECIEQHNLKLLELSEQSPDCPASILKEFFKLGFKFPSTMGFIKRQEKMYYSPDNDVWNFSYSNFYSDEFVNQIEQLGSWAGYKLTDIGGLEQLHKEFLQRQLYKNYKTLCDKIFNQIVNGEKFILPELDLLQESYLLAKLENHYGDSDIQDLNFYIGR